MIKCRWPVKMCRSTPSSGLCCTGYWNGGVLSIQVKTQLPSPSPTRNPGQCTMWTCCCPQQQRWDCQKTPSEPSQSREQRQSTTPPSSTFQLVPMWPCSTSAAAHWILRYCVRNKTATSAWSPPRATTHLAAAPLIMCCIAGCWTRWNTTTLIPPTNSNPLKCRSCTPWTSQSGKPRKCSLTRPRPPSPYPPLGASTIS